MPGLLLNRHGPRAIGRSEIRTLSCSRAVASHAADYAVCAFREACASSHVTADRRGAWRHRARTIGAPNERSVPAVGHAASCLRVSPAWHVDN